MSPPRPRAAAPLAGAGHRPGQGPDGFSETRPSLPGSARASAAVGSATRGPGAREAGARCAGSFRPADCSFRRPEPEGRALGSVPRAPSPARWRCGQPVGPSCLGSSAAGPRHRGIRTESGGRHLPLPTGRACGPVLKAGRLGSDGVSLPSCVKGVAGCGDL